MALFPKYHNMLLIIIRRMNKAKRSRENIARNEQESEIHWSSAKLYSCSPMEIFNRCMEL